MLESNVLRNPESGYVDSVNILKTQNIVKQNRMQ